MDLSGGIFAFIDNLINLIKMYFLNKRADWLGPEGKINLFF